MGFKGYAALHVARYTWAALTRAALHQRLASAWYDLEASAPDSVQCTHQLGCRLGRRRIAHADAELQALNLLRQAPQGILHILPILDNLYDAVRRLPRLQLLRQLCSALLHLCRLDLPAETGKV